MSPIVKSSICEIEFKNASKVCPLKIRPLLSAIVPLTISGILRPRSCISLFIAKSAALAFSVSKIVSTKRISAPPSIRPLADILYPRTFGDRHIVPIIFDQIYGKEFYKIILKQKYDKLYVGVQLNLTIGILQREILGITNLGSGGIKFNKNTIKGMFMLNIDNSKFSKKLILEFINRELKDVFTELGFDPNKPIQQQEPNPLPDRKALDEIVFDTLGLPPRKRKEVYWAVAELVKNRLEKAKSFKK